MRAALLLLARAGAARPLAACVLAVLALSILLAPSTGATASDMASDVSHAEPLTPINSPQAAAAAAAARLSGPSLQRLMHLKRAPVLGPAPKAQRRAAVGPAQVSACKRIPPSASSTEVCNMAAVTIPGCMYSCWDRARTAERCACCWKGQQLVGGGCEACPVGTRAGNGWNVCQPCRLGYSTSSTGGVVCNVCSAGYGVPSSAFTQPVWRCDRCPLGFYSEGNTTTACSKCSEGLTTAAAGATAATECIPAVCNSLPPAVPGIPAWPASCNGTSSCTAECSGNWTGSVGVLCGPDSSWLPPKQTCQLQQPGPEVFSGALSTNPTNVIVKSKAQILFTLKFNASLAAAAGPVKLFTCSTAGDPLQYLIDMEPTAPSGITYSASLALHGPQLGSLSSSPGVLRFTAVVGAGNRATGAVAQLELLPGCADGPAEAPPGGSRPWDVTACSASAVGQQCFTTCNWPAFDGMGYWVTCLPDGSWSGPGGFCFQMSCSGSPGPEWAGSGCTGLRVGSKCTVPCPSGQQGVGFVAECSFAGWQVSARDCSDVPTTCNFLPTLNAPAGSKGWGADCAGRANGETCQAACDGVNAYFGQGYSALCQNGEWTVLPSGGCRVCATSQTFAKRGDPLPSGTGGGLYGILPTNDGNSVLVVDQARNLGGSGRIVVYSARDLVYQTQWVAPSDVFALAQAPGPNGHVFASRYFFSDLYELSYPSGNVATVHNVGVGYYVGLAVDSVGALYGANWLNEYVTRWDAPGPNFAAPVNLQPNDGGTFVPWGVAVDARTGNVLVKVVDNAAGGTGRVVAFNSRGTFLGTLIRGLPSTAIGGMAVDRAGNIYVTQYANPGQLRKYDSSGQLLGMFGKALDTPVGVAVGADGTVWVTEEAGSAHKITCL